MAAPAIQPKLYIVQYEFVADVLEKRKPHRQAHLDLLSQQAQSGKLVIGGAVGLPPTGGLMVIRDMTPEEIEKFVQQDPYVAHGVVTNYTIKPYIAVLGDQALSNDLLKV